MKTEAPPVLDGLPAAVSRALTALAERDDFRDDRPLLARLLGSPRFAWQAGWMTVDRKHHTYVHITGWPPRLLTETCAYLGSRFVVARAEFGLLDKRRQSPFAIVLIAGRRDPSA